MGPNGFQRPEPGPVYNAVRAVVALLILAVGGVLIVSLVRLIWEALW